MSAQNRTMLMGILAAAIFGSHAGVNSALADETVKQKAEETMNDAKRSAKKAARDAKDKTCELVNGKMECAAKKVKHSIQNGADKVEDAID